MRQKSIEVFILCLTLFAGNEVWGSDAGADDGGSDGDADADTDTDTGNNQDDPCYLDNGSEAEVAALMGCNGSPPGPPSGGSTGGECTYDPLNEPYFDSKCAVEGTCYPASQWYRTPDMIRDGECGLCLLRCVRDLGDCPDGISDAGVFDLCSSNCPPGMRCWLAGELGVCVIDCWDDIDCASGVCDKAWNICVPRDDFCPDDSDTDTDDPWGSDWDGGFQPDAGPQSDASTDPEDTGGCACRASSKSDGGSLWRVFLRLLNHTL